MRKITNKISKLNEAFVEEAERLDAEFKKPRPLPAGKHPDGKGSSTSDLLIQRLAVEFGHDPVLEMVKLAKNAGLSPELKFRVNQELLSYIVPKLRPIDTNPNQGEIISINVITPGGEDAVNFKVGSKNVIEDSVR